MARFDDLPADHKAVLQLVLRQGRSYDQIAALLKISPEAVRDRAHAALAALGPASASGLDDERRAELSDYLLGQQDEGGRITTYAFLDGSAAGRAWARVVAGELRGAGVAAPDALPEVPQDGTDDADAARVTAAASAPAAAAPVPSAEPLPAALASEPVPAAATAGGIGGGERVSRTGGIILIGAVAAALVIGLLAILGVFGGDGKSSADSSTTTQAQTTSTTNGQTKVEAQVNLRPPKAGSRALAVANVVSQDGQRAIAVIGQNLAPGNHYVLWLAKGNQSKFLGFFPAVAAKGQAKGRLQGLVAAPDDLGSYDTMLITRESVDQPRTPGTVVLRGAVGQ
jgi:sigma-70-like protein